MESLIEYKVNTSNGELMFVKNSHDERIYKLGFTEQMFEDKVELVMNGYELKKEDGKIYAVKKKPKYPTTYEDCCEVLDKSPILNCPNLCICERHPQTFEMQEHFSFRKEMNEAHIAFLKLLPCRDAYWKIAGEEMGLREPWEPDFGVSESYYAICTWRHNIMCDTVKHRHYLLVFPAKEIRDTFYENFKELINSCKELL